MGLSAASAAAAEAGGESESGPELPARFAQWLEEVEPLITNRERALFVSLHRDHQREAFIEEFWKVRDPYPDTARNELKERWPLRVAEARNRYGGLEDARSRILLVHGERDAGFEVRCTGSRIVAELWGYHGSDQVDFPFAVVFVRPHPSQPASVWRPSTSGIGMDQLLSRARSCLNGRLFSEAVALIRRDADGYEKNLQRVLARPRPRSEEWVDTFVAYSTDFPADGVPLDGVLEYVFPGRYQNRTVVEGILRVPAAEARVAEFAGFRSYEFQLTGEVVIDGGFFERFRYKFGFPGDGAPAQIPLAFQRYLRPGEYTLIVKLEDLNSQRVFREERTLDVPALEQLAEIPSGHDPLSEQLFHEATEALAEDKSDVRIVPPADQLQTGFVRFDTLVSGNDIEKVRFYLDDKLIVTKNRPPYNVEIDLGAYPDLHALRVEGLDGGGAEVASDERLINGGGYRFVVRLVEPRRGKRYEKGLQARVEVEVPEGRSLDRVELYLNETLAATLYQEPFVHPLVLPADQVVSYVRAVAYLPDGNSSEDLVFVNAPDYLEQLEVQFVELYTTVLDKSGRPVVGLGRGDFTVLEDGVQQSIARFETVQDLPIHVGIMIDNSASMHGVLAEIRKAALRFFEEAISPRDRAAVITFNSFPRLAVKLTNDRAELGGGLAGLVAEGQTALYDSLMFGLYYFTGIRGQRALLVLSDGKDESSRFSFEQTLDYARRAGITIYAIGLGLADGGARSRLTRLADETGGRSFFLRDSSGLSEIYSLIQRELRSQYLIAYQSSNTSQEGAFRGVSLEVDRPDVQVKTLSGYYP